jgi:AraC-like DNA-binding protein
VVVDLPLPPDLEPFVKRMRVVLDGKDDPPGVYQRLPDGELEVFVRFGHGRLSGTVVGAHGRALRKPAPDGKASTLLVRFRAGSAYPFFGRPLSELADVTVPLRDLWGTAGLGAFERVHDARSGLEAATSALRRRLGDPYSPWAAPAVGRALRRLQRSPQLPTAAQLARDVGASERHLRRAFSEVVGMPPKRFLRVLRFQRALGMARRSADWGVIVKETGYFDQAHLIADFRALTGTTPGLLLRSR